MAKTLLQTLACLQCSWAGHQGWMIADDWAVHLAGQSSSWGSSLIGPPECTVLSGPWLYLTITQRALGLLGWFDSNPICSRYRLTEAAGGLVRSPEAAGGCKVLFVAGKCGFLWTESCNKTSLDCPFIGGCRHSIIGWCTPQQQQQLHSIKP